MNEIIGKECAEWKDRTNIVYEVMHLEDSTYIRIMSYDGPELTEEEGAELATYLTELEY